ncbi:hypothetical protein [Leucobacter sp. NPDC077196]
MIKRATMSVWSGLEGMWRAMIDDLRLVPLIMAVPVVVLLIAWGLGEI